ncbi:MAG: circadian clock KaiB family protein [Pseudomonadota bacterium]
MSAVQQSSESASPILMLFVTGTAPRSQRARASLAQMLERLNCNDIQPCEIDLLEQPRQAIKHSVFAAPSLLKVGPDGETSVLYGDLSEEERLRRFLSDLDPSR